MKIVALANSLTPSRYANTAACFAGILSMAYAYYLQFFEYLAPCPLCIFDRVFLLGILLTLATAAIHNPKRQGQRAYAGICALFCMGGLSSSGRHVWLQHLPADQVPACGPGLNYLVEAFPVADVIKLVLQGSGECAEITWNFLGLSLPEVTLLMFSIYSLYTLVQIFRTHDDQLLSN